MDELNQWYYSQPFQESEDELAYMYQQEQRPGMQQQLAEQQQHCTPSVPEPNPFRPFHSQYSSTFPRFEGPALPNQSFGAVDEHRQAQQSSSSIHSFMEQQASMLTFSGGALLEAIEGVPPAPERRSRAQWNTREHVMAERRRRGKLQQQFVALATIVPDLNKTDKITLLESTIKYVKQLEENVKTLEKAQDTRRTYVPTIFESSKSTIFESKSPFQSASGVASGSSPAIEASVHGDTVLLKICCTERRGVLVMIISELENQGMSIINANVLLFADMSLNITITAKTGEGFSTTDELVRNLAMVLRSFT